MIHELLSAILREDNKSLKRFSNYGINDSKFGI